MLTKLLTRPKTLPKRRRAAGMASPVSFRDCTTILDRPLASDGDEALDGGDARFHEHRGSRKALLTRRPLSPPQAGKVDRVSSRASAGRPGSSLSDQGGGGDRDAPATAARSARRDPIRARLRRRAAAVPAAPTGSRSSARGLRAVAPRHRPVRETIRAGSRAPRAVPRLALRPTLEEVRGLLRRNPSAVARERVQQGRGPLAAEHAQAKLRVMAALATATATSPAASQAR